MCHFGVWNSWIQKWQHYFVLTFVWSISKHFECNMCSLLTGMFCESQRSMCLLKVERIWASHGFLKKPESGYLWCKTPADFSYILISPSKWMSIPVDTAIPFQKVFEWWHSHWDPFSFKIKIKSLHWYHFNFLRFQVTQMSVAIKKTQFWNWI